MFLGRFFLRCRSSQGAWLALGLVSVAQTYGVLASSAEPAVHRGSEELLFYKIDRPLVDADRGFVWMYQDSAPEDFDGVGVARAMKLDLTSPVNFAEGRLHFYVRINRQPTDEPLRAAFAVFQSNPAITTREGAYWFESGTGQRILEGNGDEVAWSTAMDRLWIKHRDGEAHGVDWTRERYRQSLRFWTVGSAEEICCRHYDDLKAPYFPLDIDFAAVLVEKDGFFSGWETYYPGRFRQTPFHGRATWLPGRIEAEDFDVGMNGVAYLDLDDRNSGQHYRAQDAVDIHPLAGGSGFVVGAVSGEWLEYTVNLAAGRYTARGLIRWKGDAAFVNVRLDGRVVAVLSSGADVASAIDVPGGGRMTLRLEFGGGPTEIDGIVFERDDPPH